MLLFLLIAIAIPVSGWANATGNAPCPMMGSMHGGEPVLAALSECCVDMLTFSKTGKCCKTGQECEMGSIVQPAACVVFTPVQFTMRASRFLPDAFVGTHSVSVWRPPCFL